MRKQLDRQAKRLQQSRLKPGVNTATLTEAIHQTLTELRTLNRVKQPKELVGSDTYLLLVDTLRVDVDDLLAKVDPNLPPPLTKSQVKFNSFSIDNLLGPQHARKTDGSGQPLSFSLSGQQGGGEHAGRRSRSPFSASDGHGSCSDSDADSDLSSRCSSPELDVTDDVDTRPSHAPRLN